MSRYWGSACLLAIIATWAVCTGGHELGAFQETEHACCRELRVQIEQLKASHEELKREFDRCLDRSPAAAAAPASDDAELVALAAAIEGELSRAATAAKVPAVPAATESTYESDPPQKETEPSSAATASDASNLEVQTAKPALDVLAFPNCCNPELEQKVNRLYGIVGRLLTGVMQHGGTLRSHSVEIAANSAAISKNAVDIGKTSSAVAKNQAEIAANAKGLSGLSKTVAGHGELLASLSRTVAGYAPWLEAISTPRSASNPNDYEDMAPDIFGRMQAPAAEKGAEARQVPHRKYLEHVQRATNGMLKLHNNTGRDQRVIVNGTVWIASPGKSYVWVPIGPLTIGRRGGEVPEEYGTSTSEENRQWFFDGDKQWFYIVYEIN